MVTKEEALRYVRLLAEQKIITKEELGDAFESGHRGTASILASKKHGFAEILYYVGGGVVFLGVAVLLWQNWLVLSLWTKISATIGFGVAAYYAGFLFSRDKRTRGVGSAFYLISALVTPLGLWIILDSAGFDANGYGSQSLISGAMMGVYLLSLAVFRKSIFVLFGVLFGTWLFFSLTSFIVGDNPYFGNWEFYKYRILTIGFTYIVLGYAFAKSAYLRLKGFLFGFGIFSFLGAALLLGGWKPDQNIFWELIYPALVFTVLFLSVQIKNKAFLVWGTLFFITYILKITLEYFSDGLSWPITLLIAGLAMISVGYIFLSLNRKYLSA